MTKEEFYREYNLILNFSEHSSEQYERIIKLQSSYIASLEEQVEAITVYKNHEQAMNSSPIMTGSYSVEFNDLTGKYTQVPNTFAGQINGENVSAELFKTVSDAIRRKNDAETSLRRSERFDMMVQVLLALKAGNQKIYFSQSGINMWYELKPKPDYLPDFSRYTYTIVQPETMVVPL